MGAIAVPIVPGKVGAWKKFAKELNEGRSQEFKEFNERLGLTAHRAWLQENPDGTHLVIVFHEGPGGDEFIPKLAASDHPFDAWFKQQIGEAHGLDFSKPPPGPPAQLMIGR